MRSKVRLGTILTWSHSYIILMSHIMAGHKIKNKGELPFLHIPASLSDITIIITHYDLAH